MSFHPPFNSSAFNALDKASKGGRGTGITLPNICDICGKPRANYNHRRCSKIRQQMTAAQRANPTP